MLVLRANRRAANYRHHSRGSDAVETPKDGHTPVHWHLSSWQNDTDAEMGIDCRESWTSPLSGMKAWLFRFSRMYCIKGMIRLGKKYFQFRNWISSEECLHASLHREKGMLTDCVTFKSAVNMKLELRFTSKTLRSQCNGRSSLLGCELVDV